MLRARTDLARGGGQRFVDDFNRYEIFHSVHLQVAENVIEQGAIAAANFLKLYAHARFAGDIFYLRFQGEIDVEHRQHQPKIRAGAQCLAGEDARAALGELVNFTGEMLNAFHQLSLTVDVEARPAPAIAVDAIRGAGTETRAIKRNRLVLLLHLAQLVIPRRSVFDALDSELAAQNRIRSGSPDDLADRLVAATLEREQVANIDVARANQPRTVRKDVIGAGSLGCAAFLTHETPADGQGKMQQFAGEKPFVRRVKNALQGWWSFVRPQ